MTKICPWSNASTTEAAQYLADKAKQGFDAWQTLGRIYTKQDGNLILFNYTAQAQYEGDFTAIEAACRGLVVDKESGEIAARPFDKFFNWGERGYIPHRDAYMQHVTTKLDGSLIIGFWYHDLRYLSGELSFKFVTRGSFDSIQARMGEQVFRKTSWDRFSFVPENITLMMELIHPDNRIVVDYGKTEMLYLLAARNRNTGEYLPYFPDLYNLSLQLNLEIPPVWSFNKPADILEDCGKLGPNAEGYVAQFSDGTRWKFKGDEYLEIAKLVNGLSKKRVARMIKDGTYTHKCDVSPLHIRKQMQEWGAEIDDEVDDKLVAIWAEFNCADAETNSRKDFALWLKKHSPAWVLPYAFAIADGFTDYQLRQMVLDREF